jgi:hypothetical protein
MWVPKRAMWAMLAMMAGAGLAAVLLPAARRRRSPAAESARVDEASEDSFPASDPPSFSASAKAQVTPPGA